MLDRTKAPEIRPFGKLDIPSETITVLLNGVVLHILNGGDQDVARLSLIAEGGTADCENPCFASFAAELLREGAANYSSEQIADILDYNGAWLITNATSHHTVIQLSALSSKICGIVPMITECLVSPVFPKQPFEVIRKKGAARQELNLSRVSFIANADNKRLICGVNHPGSKLIMPEDIENISCDEIAAFHRNRLNANLTHAYLCGHLDNHIIDSISSSLCAIPETDALSPIQVIPYHSEQPETSTHDKKGSLQCAVALSIPAISRSHPDYNPLRMAVTALGGYFGSRLMLNIREEKGYTYGISAALLGAQEGSYITINAQCDNRHTYALIDEVRHELRQLAERPLDNDELHRLKFNAASDLASTLDSPFSVMDYYELRRTIGIPDNYFYARQETLAKITPEIICSMARKYLNPDELRISIAGDLNLTSASA